MEAWKSHEHLQCHNHSGRIDFQYWEKVPWDVQCRWTSHVESFIHVVAHRISVCAVPQSFDLSTRVCSEPFHFLHTSWGFRSCALVHRLRGTHGVPMAAEDGGEAQTRNVGRANNPKARRKQEERQREQGNMCSATASLYFLVSRLSFLGSQNRCASSYTVVVVYAESHKPPLSAPGQN
jgi:hypothetical protein